MARNISISVSVQDQYSQSISSMREKTVAFNKDIEELTAKIKSLNKETYMVSGNRGNIKITTIGDLYILRALIRYKEDLEAFGLQNGK